MTTFITTKFTASDTWTWPDGETEAEAQVWGGGSGGESSIPSDRGGAGGGGGGFARCRIAKTSATTLDVHVGAGGAPGFAGGDSWVQQDSTDVAKATGGGAATSGGGGLPGSGVDLGGAFQTLTDGGHGGQQGFGLFPASDSGRGGGCSGGQNISSGVAPPFGSSIGYRAPGGGLAGQGGLVGTPNEDGHDAPERGGGGGGGARGKTSGSGHAGEVWITCPPSLPGAPCCCSPGDCSREAFGLPDTINASFGVTPSSDGMPADSETGAGCDSGPQSHYRWSVGTPLAGLLNGAYAFSEISTDGGGCCFLYQSVGDYSPSECGSGSGYRTTGNPYLPGAEGTHVTTFNYTGHCDDRPGNVFGTLCDTTPVAAPSCGAVCGSAVSVTDGTLSIPLPIYGSADMLICVLGDYVAISATAGANIPCRTYPGSHNYGSPITGYVVGGGDPCTDHTICASDATCDSGSPDFTPCEDGDTGCATREGSAFVSMSALLTDVSGANIWEKIQNCTTWEGTYGESSCSCVGDGCAGSREDFLCGCLCTGCFCVSKDPGDPDSTCNSTVTPGDSAVDIPCIYSSGTATGSFS